jgi:hypothetical protein
MNGHDDGDSDGEADGAADQNDEDNRSFGTNVSVIADDESLHVVSSSVAQSVASNEPPPESTPVFDAFASVQDDGSSLFSSLVNGHELATSSVIATASSTMMNSSTDSFATSDTLCLVDSVRPRLLRRLLTVRPCSPASPAITRRRPTSTTMSPFFAQVGKSPATSLQFQQQPPVQQVPTHAAVPAPVHTPVPAPVTVPVAVAPVAVPDVPARNQSLGADRVCCNHLLAGRVDSAWRRSVLECVCQLGRLDFFRHCRESTGGCNRQQLCRLWCMCRRHLWRLRHKRQLHACDASSFMPSSFVPHAALPLRQ